MGRTMPSTTLLMVKNSIDWSVQLDMDSKLLIMKILGLLSYCSSRHGTYHAEHDVADGEKQHDEEEGRKAHAALDQQPGRATAWRDD
jgi:hypothetical protein